MDQAAIVLIKALTSLVDIDPAEVPDAPILSAIWINKVPEEININLRLYVQALQIVAVDNLNRMVDAMLARLDTELAGRGANTWGAVLASSFLAIRFYKKHPELANSYLLLYLRTLKVARLPDGQPMPGADTPLEELFWATAQGAKTDDDVKSWIATVQQLDAGQNARLAASSLASDSATIICDGIWFRDYKKPEGERDWDRVEQLVRQLESLGHRKGLQTLEAAALRTLIMIQAEWRHDMDGALQLAESSLPRFTRDEDAFLITEVTGRQLSYAGRSIEAIAWMQRARISNYGSSALATKHSDYARRVDRQVRSGRCG